MDKIINEKKQSRKSKYPIKCLYKWKVLCFTSFLFSSRHNLRDSKVFLNKQKQNFTACEPRFCATVDGGFELFVCGCFTGGALCSSRWGLKRGGASWWSFFHLPPSLTSRGFNALLQSEYLFFTISFRFPHKSTRQNDAKEVLNTELPFITCKDMHKNVFYSFYFDL